LFAEESSFPLTKSFTSKLINVSEDLADIQSAPHASDTMSVNQLSKFVKKNKEAGLDTLRYEVEYQGKFAFAMAAFVMSLMGIPFSVSQRRSGGSMINIGICVGLAFLYWMMFSSFLTFGRHGII